MGGAAQVNQKSAGNFFSSGRIGKANSLERSNAQIPPLVTHDSQTQLQSVRNDARTIQHDQLRPQQQLLRNTQNSRPFHSSNLNQHGNIPFVTQVHGVQSSPQIPIQSTLDNSKDLKPPNIFQPISQVLKKCNQFSQ